MSIKENSRLLKRIEILDLSYNLLSDDAIKKLCEFINDTACELKEINLEGNNLGDKLVVQICDSVINYLADKLILLNFGRNQIGNKGALSMSQICQYCVNLKVLVLYWNNIINYFASLIIRNLKKHSEIKVLDLSWNCIGNNLLIGNQNKEKPKELKKIEKTEKKDGKDGKKDEKKGGKKDDNQEVKVNNKDVFEMVQTSVKKPGIIPVSNNPKGISEFARELGEYFRDDSVDLIHLDISHNNLNLIDCTHISEEVKFNHTILGIHVDGNEMNIDELGFIHPLKRDGKIENQCADSQIYYKIDREHFIKTKINNIRKIRAKNNCWICEGWKEIEFIYKLSDETSKKLKGPPEVTIHLGFDGWKPNEMIHRNDHWVYYRMCPPGEVYYFFSVNTEIDTYSAKGEKFIDLKEQCFTYEFKVPKEDDVDEIEVVTRTVSRVCRKYAELWTTIIDSTYKKYLVYCVPRPEKKIDLNIKPRTPWTYPISVWYAYEYNYEGDNKDYLDKVFDHDFSRINRNRDGEIDESIMECKKVLRDYFRFM